MIPIHSWNKRAHFKDETGITSITIINAPNQQVPYNIKKKIKNRSPKKSHDAVCGKWYQCIDETSIKNMWKNAIEKLAKSKNSSFHLRWKENLVKHRKVSKYDETDFSS